MTDSKLSSYQKLKLKIEEQSEYIRKLQKAIYEDDKKVLDEEKAFYGYSMLEEKMLFFGDNDIKHTTGIVNHVGVINTKKK